MWLRAHGERNPTSNLLLLSVFLVPCDIDAWTRNASYMMHSRQSCNDSIITQLHNLVRVRNVCTVPQLAVLPSLIFLVGHSGTVQLYA